MRDESVQADTGGKRSQMLLNAGFFPAFLGTCLSSASQRGKLGSVARMEKRHIAFHKSFSGLSTGQRALR